MHETFPEGEADGASVARAGRHASGASEQEITDRIFAAVIEQRLAPSPTTSLRAFFRHRQPTHRVNGGWQ
jgi:hypothetical protein